MLVDVELRRRNACPEDSLGGHVVALDGEAAERALQLVERQAGVEECAEEHVARDA